MGFSKGQYVNTQDGLTAYIYGEDDEGYQIAICERDEERTCTDSDLTLYTGSVPVWSD